MWSDVIDSYPGHRLHNSALSSCHYRFPTKGKLKNLHRHHRMRLQSRTLRPSWCWPGQQRRSSWGQGGGHQSPPGGHSWLLSWLENPALHTRSSSHTDQPLEGGREPFKKGHHSAQHSTVWDVKMCLFFNLFVLPLANLFYLGTSVHCLSLWSKPSPRHITLHMRHAPYLHAWHPVSH